MSFWTTVLAVITALFILKAGRLFILWLATVIDGLL